MKRSFIHIICLGMLVASCSTEDVADEGVSRATTEDVVTIVGGRPDAALTAVQSRAVSEPSLYGVAKADKMLIWVYTKNQYAWGNVEDLAYKETLPEMDVVNTQQQANGSIDRWVKRDYTFTANGATGTHFAMPALAYSEADKSLFALNTGSNYTAATLSLTTTQAPEMYFGRTRFTFNPVPTLITVYDEKWESDGWTYYYKTGLANANYTQPMSGKLYRIVSQVNVSIADVPTDIVERFEIFATDVPTKLYLYGNHGKWYPVRATTSSADCAAGATLMAAASTFAEGEAHMSWFMLPSEVGCTMTLRIHYVAGAVKDDSGNDVAYRDFPLRPGKSALMTGDDAECYYNGVQTATLKNGTDVYVYNSSNNRFYSYANVRVNITGKYENFAAETQDVSVTLEVEPSYEREHTITIN